MCVFVCDSVVSDKIIKTVAVVAFNEVSPPVWVRKSIYRKLKKIAVHADDLKHGEYQFCCCFKQKHQKKSTSITSFDKEKKAVWSNQNK